MRYPILIALSLLISSSVAAQGRDVTLSGHLDEHERYNDIWGYVAPGGDEYALLGTTQGTAVIDCSDPTRPVERGFFPGPSSTWRDIRTYSSYAYVVTEGGGGMQILDLSDPNSPSLVQTWDDTLWGNAHNICIDTATGRIYVVGTTNGTAVIDAAANPADPTFFGWHLDGTRESYYHDFHVQNGIGHGSMIRNGFYRILDVTTWPFTVLSDTPTPSTFTHNAWPNATDTIVATTDERTAAVVKFWDVSDPTAPVGLGSYTANPNAIPHNAFIVGDICHISFYTEGYRAVDISDPNDPVEIGSYDTWPGGTGGFNGAWGVYPFQPSGNIYVSDISTGLYVVRLNELSVDHVALTDTIDETGPYEVTALVRSGTAISEVALSWAVGGGASTKVVMTPTGVADEYRATIPGHFAPAIVDYFIEATNVDGSMRLPSSTTSYRFEVGATTRVYFDDFEGGANGWTHGSENGTQDDWQQGAPNGLGGTSGGVGWTDPPAAFSGTAVWANDLGDSGFNGAYASEVSNWLQSPPIPTGGVQGLNVRFRRWLSVEEGIYDQARFEVNGQVVWENPANGHTVDTSWQEVEYDISAIADSAPTLTLRFTLTTDGGLNLGGWTIDDVEVFFRSDCLPPEHFGAGTPGTGGAVPTIDVAGEPRVGSTTFEISGAGMLPLGQAFLGVGLGRGSLTAFSVTALLDPMIATLPADIDAAGTASIPFPIPDRVNLDNADIYVQWLVIDSGSPGGLLSASDGLRFRICRF